MIIIQSIISFPNPWCILYSDKGQTISTSYLAWNLVELLLPKKKKEEMNSYFIVVLLQKSQHHLPWAYIHLSSSSVPMPPPLSARIPSATLLQPWHFLIFFRFSLSNGNLLPQGLGPSMDIGCANRWKVELHFTKGYSRSKDEQAGCSFEICYKD